MLKRTLFINGVETKAVIDPELKLSEFLREQLHLTGTKVGCNKGECGACSVILDGKVVRSCITKMKNVKEDAEIITIEGVGSRENLHPLQLAWMVHGGAQCGFCTPGFIVSAAALLEENINPARTEVRDWFRKHRNLCRCTGYIPLVDAVMDAAKLMRGEIKTEDLWYKLPKGSEMMGTEYIRPSALGKVTGTWDFGSDLGLKLPKGTLHAKLVQAEVSHANILSIDTSEAEKMPGVYRVLTYKDVPGTNRINGLAFPQNKGDGKERPILCDKKVFQYGDPFAIVLSTDPHTAEEAVKKVKVDLEVLPAYMSVPEAMAEDAIEIHPGTPNVYFECGVIKGEETEPIFEKAKYTVEDDFYVGRQPHMPLENDVGFAYMDEEGKLIVHSKSVAIHFHHLMTAEGIGVEPDKYVIVQNNAGATFGYKFSPTIEGLLGVAALVTKKPVYLEFTQEQHFAYTGKRSPFFMNVKFAADEEGKLLGMEGDYFVDHGAYCEFGDLLALRGTQFMGAGYNIPNIRNKGRTVATNHAWGSAFRGYGSPQSLFSTEVLMDELAEKMGSDPFELRYKNVYRQGDTTPQGCQPEVYCLVEALDKIKPYYEEAKKKAEEKNKLSEEYKYGAGISLLIYGSGLDGVDTSEAWAEITPRGVTVGNSWEDHGQGADMGTLYHAYDALLPLGLEPEQIRLVMNDMEKTPNSGPAGGSRSTVTTGNATRVACENLVKALQKPDGTYMTYDEVTAAGIPTKYEGKWSNPGISQDVVTGQGNPFVNYMYGVLLAEVKVNMNTGKAEAEQLTIVADIGKVGNKLITDGQIYGGLAQGIGLALTEDYEDIHYHNTFTKAGMPQIKDVPDNIKIIYQETPRPHGSRGSSGVGELPLSAPHAAIVNAIYHACGVRITKLPALPEKILEGLEENKNLAF